MKPGNPLLSGRRQKVVLTAVALAAVVLLGTWAAAQPGRWHVIAAYRTGLDDRTPAQIHNARLAVQAIDGRLLPPGGEFSFNKTVGSWSADRGYVKAPVSYEGELIPSWGGGVCQASTTLYNAALLAGLEILERHRHQFPPRYAPPGQDAAVAQYNIDLRFRNPYDRPVRIEAEVRGKWLICRIISRKLPDGDITVEREIREVIPPGRGGQGERHRSGNDLAHGHPWGARPARSRLPPGDPRGTIGAYPNIRGHLPAAEPADPRRIGVFVTEDPSQQLVSGSFRGKNETAGQVICIPGWFALVA